MIIDKADGILDLTMRHFGRAEKNLPVTGKDGLAMTVEDVRAVLGARVLVGKEHLDREVRTACGSDMMSDVLAFSKDHGVLLTGLVNPQVVRTAEMLDIVCIIFIRGKKADEKLLDMARERDLVVLETGHRMFTACGLLYEAGLRGGAI